MIENLLETAANKVVAKHGLPTENAVVIKFFCPKHTYYTWLRTSHESI